MLIDKTASTTDGDKPAMSETVIQSSSAAVKATSSEGDPSSASSRLMAVLPPPPPPPLPLVLPDGPTVVSYFPPLPPPPVEFHPIQLPPRHIRPHARCTLHSGFPHQPAMLHGLLHRPLTTSSTSYSPNSLYFPSTEQCRPTHRNEPQSDESLPSTVSSVPLVTSQPTSNPKSSGEPVIRDFKTKGATPRFIPRQLLSGRSAVSNQDSKTVPVKSDAVIEQLKQSAFVLGSKVQGPCLPSSADQKRKEFKSSETGNESLDKTVSAIRHKVSQVSATVKF